MSIHTLKCPSHFVASIYKHKTCIKARSNRILIVQPSSILVQTDDNSNLFEFQKSSSSSSCATSISSQVNSPLASHVNTIGIIGGVSSISTVNFLDKLVRWSSTDGVESLPFVLCNDPLLNKELLSHKSVFPHRNTKNVHLEMDLVQILENLRLKKTFLEKSGAGCIVMPCDISHMWHGEISKGCSVPFLHVGECVAKELKEANFKPIEAGSGLRIGVLSTDASLTADVYQEKLQSQGFEVVLPDKATTEHTIIPAVEALNRKDIVGARNLLRIALQVLLVRAVNIVILASDDIRDLLPRNDPLRSKCFDPMDALARSTIKWAQSTEKAHKKS